MKTPRSVYLARLRRAFLLRVHPDRFQCASIRTGQAALVKALSSRLSQADFTAWQHHGSSSPSYAATSNNNKNTRKNSRPSSTEEKPFSYVLEQRDGAFLETSLSLNESVEAILNSMASALRQVGASSSIPDESEALSSPQQHQQQQQQPETGKFSADPYPSASTPGTASTTTIDHQFDIHSQEGRNLLHFLTSYDSDEIQQRKASRMDAQAAALAVRRLYGFQAVDATSLGWSSAWVANLLRRLIALHREHAASNFSVETFYPVRLQFTNAAAQTAAEHHLDVVGGVLYLSPATTSIQWLESLQLVTVDKLEEIHSYQRQLLEYTKDLKSALGVKLKKGHSCSNAEYFCFLQELHQSIITRHSHNNTNDSSCNQLATEMTTAAVEAPQVCRRPKVTADGSIRLGAGMTPEKVVTAISRLGPLARDKHAKHRGQLERCKEAIHQAQWQLGVQKVTRSRVSHDEFLSCLGRLLAASQQVDASSLLQMRLGGNSLSIAGTGHFCHLADDGSLVIPHNWQ